MKISAAAFSIAAHFITLGVVSTSSPHALAEDRSVYQVVVETRKAGKRVGSSSLIVLEGQKGEIKSVLADATGTYFDVVVRRGPAEKLSLDYRFTDKTAKRSLEIAKTSVELAPGATETSELKDSSGEQLELHVTVKNGAEAGSEKTKQTFKLRD